MAIPVASLKLPPIQTLSYATTRAKAWDDIVTGHADETFARTWSMQNKKLGSYAFSLANENKRGAVTGAVKVLLLSLRCEHCVQY